MNDLSANALATTMLLHAALVIIFSHASEPPTDKAPADGTQPPQGH